MAEATKSIAFVHPGETCVLAETVSCTGAFASIPQGTEVQVIEQQEDETIVRWQGQKLVIEDTAKVYDTVLAE